MPDKSCTRRDRVKWLRDHPEVTKIKRNQVIEEMKRAGVLSEKTHRFDVNLYNLMCDAGFPRRVCIKFSLAPLLHGGTS